jgi:hypothetical protein
MDIMRSLLRGAARSAADRLRHSELASRLQRMLSEAVGGRVRVSDADLSAAVARVRDISAVTVHTVTGAVHVEASFEDGRSLAVRLAPSHVRFAPGGAKELSFTVAPPEALNDPHTSEIFAATAGAVARALWRPVLRGQPLGEPSAFVTHEGARLVLDLRTVPEIRNALQNKMAQAFTDVLALERVEAEPGGLSITLAMPRGFGA